MSVPHVPVPHVPLLHIQYGTVTAFWASPHFGHPHSQIPSVLGIPFSYYCSVLGIPRYPSGMPKSLVFWSSSLKKRGIRGKIENVLEMASAKYRNLFQYLKKKAYPEGFTKQKNDSAKICQKVRV